jgi:hypothetical protein
MHGYAMQLHFHETCPCPTRLRRARRRPATARATGRPRGGRAGGAASAAGSSTLPSRAAGGEPGAAPGRRSYWAAGTGPTSMPSYDATPNSSARALSSLVPSSQSETLPDTSAGPGAAAGAVIGRGRRLRVLRVHHPRIRSCPSGHAGHGRRTPKPANVIAQPRAANSKRLVGELP